MHGVWQLGLDAIENLTEVLEDKGLKVHVIEATDAFDALTFPADGDAVIIGNARQPTDRLRFSLAHELGHLVLEPAADVDAEKAANRFAGAFLVPQETARREIGSKRHCLDLVELILLRRKYGLSVQAWINRAQDLGILSEAAATRPFDELVRLGGRRSEIGPKLPDEEPRRMEILVRRALAEDLISRSRAAELLGRTIAEFYAKEKVETDGAPAVCA
ncbi:MAG: ImmA/IrrE family metallo-endopeptidase [Proteobacteria bacterium]|nr:ImmA/IrrE family metallo-endopeptidase [Pseudomonadota bacterium]